MEQKNEMLTSILAAITTRQNLRREWHARFVLLRNGICCPWKMRALCGEALPDGWPHPSQWRGHEKKEASYRCLQPKFSFLPLVPALIAVIHDVICMQYMIYPRV